MLLAPKEAAASAGSVYRIIDEPDVKLLDNFLLDNFEIGAKSRFEGTAGAMFFKYKSGFGIIAKGKSDRFRDDIIVVTRGTERIVQDLLLTDANVGIQSSPSGRTVHAGFNKVFNSFDKDISNFLRGKNPNRIHCVGHSLGGALATLVADWASVNNAGNPILYTFGSPRVGGPPFARHITNFLASDNIYRLYHKTDVVSMVPMWPFTHVPMPTYDSEYFIDSPGMPGVNYHYMKAYESSIKNKTWKDLRQSPPPTNIEKQVDAWLVSDGPLSLTYNTVKMIGEALLYLIKKILHIAGIGVQIGISTGLTLLDMLALAAEKAVAVSKEIGSFVSRLMKRILSALGMNVNVEKNITATFIRWVLQNLQKRLYRMATTALQAAHHR